MGEKEEIIRKTAKAARLRLTEEETKKYSKEIKEVLEAFSKIQEVKTDGVERSLHPYKIKTELRGDKPSAGLGEEGLKLTKHKKNQYYKGPKLQ